MGEKSDMIITKKMASDMAHEGHRNSVLLGLMRPEQSVVSTDEFEKIYGPSPVKRQREKRSKIESNNKK